MDRKWILRQAATDVALAPGEAGVLREGNLCPISHAGAPVGEAFVRARAARLCVMAAPGRLLVDGKLALGGVAVLGRGRHTLRVGQVRLEAWPQSSRLTRYSGDEPGRCALSGEIITCGDKVVECVCGATVREEFARQYGGSCARCGEALPIRETCHDQDD